MSKLASPISFFLSEEVPGLEKVYDIEKNIPGSVTYSINRFLKKSDIEIEDTGVLMYNYENSKIRNNNLQLKFCITGKMYCNHTSPCQDCKLLPRETCKHNFESVDILSFTFSKSYLYQFSKGLEQGKAFANNVLSFKHKSSFSRTLPMCGKSRQVIEALLNHSYTDALENIFVNAQTQILLLYSLDCMLGEKEEISFTCKFLANEDDREKIMHAREVLLQHIGEPLTIKMLSRKVGINECYLKKGFKEIFGTTIFDFYQSQRMEHAKYLLYEKGLSVTDVSLLLGYSSISHFSTAFKKHTGLKPCELLFR